MVFSHQLTFCGAKILVSAFSVFFIKIFFDGRWHQLRWYTCSFSARRTQEIKNIIVAAHAIPINSKSYIFLRNRTPRAAMRTIYFFLKSFAKQLRHTLTSFLFLLKTLRRLFVRRKTSVSFQVCDTMVFQSDAP